MASVLWLLQIPAPILGFLTVALVIGLSVGGLIVFRKAVSHTRLENANAVSGQVFQLAGVLYAVLVAFVVVVVWEQFGDAENATQAEASAIADLLRDSTAIPVAFRPEVQRSLVAYTEDVVNDELPRMRRGETIEEESDHTTDVWTAFLKVQPETRNEIAFFDHDIVKLNDLSANRKLRVSTGSRRSPASLGAARRRRSRGDGVHVPFEPRRGARGAVALTAGLMGFVLYLIFALEHPFVGALSVKPDYVNVLRSGRAGAPVAPHRRRVRSAVGRADGSGPTCLVDRRLESLDDLEIVGRGYPGEDVEEVRIRADEDAGLARLDTPVNDLRGLVRRRHRGRRRTPRRSGRATGPVPPDPRGTARFARCWC